MMSFVFRSVTRALCYTAVSLVLYASSAQAASGFVAGKDGMLSVPEASPLRSQIQVAAVQVGMPRDTLTVPGNIAAEPRRIFPLLPPVTGRILSVSATPGQHVVRGQELVRIMSGDMAQAVTDQEKAEAGLLMARSAMVRAQEVRKAGGAATKDVEAAHAALLDAEAEEERARLRLLSLTDKYGGEGGVLVLRAPASGVIASLSAAPGVNITDMTAPLLVMEDLSEVWVVANIAEVDGNDVQVGQSVVVSLPAREGIAIPAQVSSVEPDFHADTRRLQAMIVLANPDEDLKPNMFASVAIQIKQPVGLMVPQSALLMNNDTVTVFVETAPWVFQRRVITISYDEGENTQVLSGLRIGERIIVRGGVLLNDD
ncbi:efflux RND transporter periplasmic adaptor subunit [Acetobacter thailandicus]|uniref:Efflux RND transporter periplasmic adaptor subunit n=1 Tax=Acetobacter thailandicus TaxID=1502842 RepID=A0ABT3QED9_9PROT|nr:efflux RND transporter periplasmic adaptor subunit [Acetobacter thailandicus]MCX2563663.1 efflux RND transporter periplasmic adaptor subunit [Acetobacter thailandicus]NHN94413.1 efflux RND transporter periplasmic adaptor subunit [Acetobacter thailandicus]